MKSMSKPLLDFFFWLRTRVYNYFLVLVGPRAPCVCIVFSKNSSRSIHSGYSTYHVVESCKKGLQIPRPHELLAWPNCQFLDGFAPTINFNSGRSPDRIFPVIITLLQVHSQRRDSRIKMAQAEEPLLGRKEPQQNQVNITKLLAGLIGMIRIISVPFRCSIHQWFPYSFLAGVFLASADKSILLATQGEIASSLNSPASAPLLLVSYNLGFCIALPLVFYSCRYLPKFV